MGSAAANLTQVLEDEESEKNKELRRSFQATLAQGTGISKDEVRVQLQDAKCLPSSQTQSCQLLCARSQLFTSHRMMMLD